MALPVNVRTLAEDDIFELAAYIAQNKNLETSLRFVDAAYDSMETLADHPLAGPLVDFPPSILTLALRRWRVRGFPNHLIFYLAHESSIEIIRVLHGARDFNAELFS
jgi:toxin ParE1/3/4